MAIGLNPRLSGIYEHQERAHFFSKLAIEATEDTARHRLLIATLYSCRAIVEIMLESAKQQDLQNFRNADCQASRKAFEAHIRLKLPYYGLIERIRIHDFHRFGLCLANSDFDSLMMLGPIKLVAQRGASSVTIAGALNETKTGNSHVELQRPLVRSNDNFFDDETSRWASLEEILSSFLSKAPDAIRFFEDQF